MFVNRNKWLPLPCYCNVQTKFHYFDFGTQQAFSFKTQFWSTEEFSNWIIFNNLFWKGDLVRYHSTLQIITAVWWTFIRTCRESPCQVPLLSEDYNVRLARFYLNLNLAPKSGGTRFLTTTANKIGGFHLQHGHRWFATFTAISVNINERFIRLSMMRDAHCSVGYLLYEVTASATHTPQPPLLRTICLTVIHWTVQSIHHEWGGGGAYRLF